jgi:hypothetical protein
MLLCRSNCWTEFTNCAVRRVVENEHYLISFFM